MVLVGDTEGRTVVLFETLEAATAVVGDRLVGIELSVRVGKCVDAS